MPIAIPRFQQLAQLVDSNGFPTTTFHIWWDRVAQNLEDAFNALEGQVTDIAAAQAAAAAAQADATAALTSATTALNNATTALNDAATALTAANNAQTTANTAQTTANTASTTAAAASTTATTAQNTANDAKRNDGIASSWTSPGAILSAVDVGTTASINIASHIRKYNDQISVNVVGSTITGLAFLTPYYIYYDDPNRNGGAVTYHAATNPNDALPGGVPGRHFCGTVTTPADGGSTVTGTYDPPSGGGGVKGGQIP